MVLFAACAPHRDGSGAGDDDGNGSPDAGAPSTLCQQAMQNPSNLGCEFWAVDLDNEATSISNAAKEQFAIVAANNNDGPVTVTVTQNLARVGAPVSEDIVMTVTVPPRTAQRIDLPQREVDGSMGQNSGYVMNSGTGTFVSPHAFHVVSSDPVVVYQFNPIIQDFSNDASTLIPLQAMGADYTIIGFPTANPCAPVPVDPSIPDHTAITIIPTQDDTHVTIVPNHPIAAAGGDTGIAIAMTPKGTPLNLTLSRYDVANLESYQPGDIGSCATNDGDFTGSTVHSDKPVAVFTSAERAIGFGGADNVVYPPDWVASGEGANSICCTDHLEEQLFPVTALGHEFAIARSPIRSTNPNWKEPDIVRVIATVDNTVVTTNLPAPYNSISLSRNQQKTFASTTGFTMSANNPVEVSTYLVPNDFVTQGWIGDASQLLMPAAEQFRKDYVFLVPGSFTNNYIVVAMPTNAAVMIDGAPIGSQPGCYTGPIGDVMGMTYQQVTCPATEGHHTVAGDQPIGLSVYGYYVHGSYAFIGGSDVKIINPIE
ncbi:MAG: IgGFc-binding protein [Kofleriaceae bacterium]